jgi:hypothetical protein
MNTELNFRSSEYYSAMLKYNPMADARLTPQIPRGAVMSQDWIRLQRPGRLLVETIAQMIDGLIWLHTHGCPGITQSCDHTTIAFSSFDPVHITFTASEASANGHDGLSPELLRKATHPPTSETTDAYCVGLILLTFLVRRERPVRMRSFVHHFRWVQFIQAQLEKKKTKLSPLWTLAWALICWNPHHRLSLEGAAKWCKKILAPTT